MEAPDLKGKTTREISKAARRGLRGALLIVAVSVIPVSVYAYSVFGESTREPDVAPPVADSLPEETETERELITSGEFVATLPTTNLVGSENDVSDALPDEKPKKETAQEIQPPTANSTAEGLPVRIIIPSIGVDAPIKRVALASDGSMDVPKRPFDTVWYERGARPGETGTATIAGHVDWVNGADAVFTDLHKLKPGDTISVQNDLGVYTSFVVRSLREYDAKEDASDVFYSYDGKSHLNLVTCSGAWDASKKEFSKRLVVFADMAVEE